MLQLTGLVAYRTSARFVGDSTFAVDQVEPIRHPAVCVAHAIVELVDQEWEAWLGDRAIFLGDRQPLGLVGRLLLLNADLAVTLDQPAVGRMRSRT